MWRHRNDCERAIPFGAELAKEEPEFGVEQPYFLVWLKCLRLDVSVMKCLCLLLVNFGAVICIVSQLPQLCQLKLSVGANCLHIKVEMLDCPQSFVLQFHREVTCLSINQSVWKASQPIVVIECIIMTCMRVVTCLYFLQEIS
jgi:hypothetical protein